MRHLQLCRASVRGILVHRSSENRLQKRHGVSTWSSLATAFNTRPERKLNLSFTKEDVVR
jgi:hypothetical protein